MERTPKGIYTPEFRAEAVKLVETTRMSVARAAKQLSMPKSSLDNWGRSGAAKRLRRAMVCRRRGSSFFTATTRARSRRRFRGPTFRVICSTATATAASSMPR